MNDIELRTVAQFPEPAYTALASEVFADYEHSVLLTRALEQEAASRPGNREASDEGALRVGAFRSEDLVGWTYARPDGMQHLHMINSGVATAERRRGIYSQLVQHVIEHSKSRGYASIVSRHQAYNNAVIVAKLKLGFFVSGFEYSEVYGPLVRLTYLVGELRRTLYASRSGAIRRERPGDA